MSLKYILIFLLINNILGEEQYYIKIKDKEYQIELESSETANQIKSKLPFTISMNNLNGNEVYYYFDESFKTNQQSVGTINQGDIYLYQDKCLVLFYKTFTTTYTYTKIGKVINPEGLDTLIGSGNVEVMWFSKSEPEENPKDSANNNVDNTDKNVDRTDKNMDSTYNNIDRTDNNLDGTDNSTKISDTKKISEEDEDENEIFDNYSFGRFLKFNYFVWLFISIII